MIHLVLLPTLIITLTHGVINDICGQPPDDCGALKCVCGLCPNKIDTYGCCGACYEQADGTCSGVKVNQCDPNNGGTDCDGICAVPCTTDAECSSDKWCRATCDGKGSVCAPFASVDDHCGGFTLPCWQERCSTGMTCFDTTPLLADDPGICVMNCGNGYEFDSNGACVPTATVPTAKCAVGDPLKENGVELFCGRGPNNVACPDGSICNISPTDTYAVCCIDTTCGDNEEYQTCSGCEQTCDPTPIFCTMDCKPAKCQCKNGFVRGPHGNCITEDECPAVPTTTVQGVDCSLVKCAKPVCLAGEEEFTPQGECCAQCKPIFCGGFAGFKCPTDDLECIDDPTDDCDPLNDGADCGGICVPKLECKDPNAEMSGCTNPCPPTCEEPISLCKAPCTIPGTCECKSGFVLGPNDECITQDECPAVPTTTAQDCTKICTLQYDPVCCNGVTYSNQCSAEANCLVFDDDCVAGACLDCSLVNCAKPLCLAGEEEFTPQGECCAHCVPKLVNNPCEIGEPIQDTLGVELFCGRGTNRVDCPTGSTCNIAPTDEYAVCCPDVTTATTATPVIDCDTCEFGYNNGCQDCTCNADGTESCDSKLCITLNDRYCLDPTCVQCPYGYFDGCNNCKCDTESKLSNVQCESNICKTKLDPYCKCNGIWKDGECVEINCDSCDVYNDGCNDCICQSDGTISCTKKECLIQGELSCISCIYGYKLNEEETECENCSNDGIECDECTSRFFPDIQPFEKGEDKVCTLCYKDDGTIVDSWRDAKKCVKRLELYDLKADVKDCYMDYCRKQGKTYWCNSDEIGLVSDLSSVECGCDMLVCGGVGSTAGVERFGIMISSVFVVGILYWM